MRRVSLPESVEDKRQERGIDADAGVGDAQFDLALGGRRRRRDGASGRCELDGVGQQVPDNLLQSLAVRQDTIVLNVVTNDECYLLAFRGGPYRFDGRSQGLGEADAPGVE